MQSQSKKRYTDDQEVRNTSGIPDVADDSWNDLLHDNTAMTTAKQYREVIRSGKRWVALKLFNGDRALEAYYQLTERERMEIDLLVDMARESL